MFGYILPFKPELKIKEYGCYRSYYCGVCKELGREYQQICRFSLNYDIVFLAILFSSFSEAKERISLERCIVNPVKKRPVVQKSSALEYATAIHVALIYYKLMDNWDDEKRMSSLLAAQFLKPAFRKGLKKYKSQYEVIFQQLSSLKALEREKVPFVDQACQPFAEMMAQLFQYPECDDLDCRTLKWMGYNLGKWIYLLDAYQDISHDKKQRNYNVLLEKYGRDLAPEVIRQSCREEVEFVLKTCLLEIGKAYELLNICKNHAVLENIIYLGLNNRMQEILNDRRDRSHGSI